MDANVLEQLLLESNYDPAKTKFVVDGFRFGFNLKFSKKLQGKQRSPNLKITVGSETELWNKVMHEVNLQRYAGPYKDPPFDEFIQSPIGLVPKDGGAKTRLIFHLSYPRGSGRSVNENTPKECCSVKYKDFSDAIMLCLNLSKKGACWMGKTDLVSAFRILGIRPEDWCLLVLKARHPITKEIFYFVDKCLPFGHAISCALFQEVSDALAHIFAFRSSAQAINYLDDFFFADARKKLCNRQIDIFLGICLEINFPVSDDKTVWATTKLSFLGLLIDALNRLVCIPVQKIQKAESLIHLCLDRRSKKITLLELQKIAGFLNFLCRAVVPGRPFTRRLYYATVGLDKPFHHTRITGEIRKDLEMWLNFLSHPSVYCRPFYDFTADIYADQVKFYTDASGNYKLGAGGICQRSWFYLQWDHDFMTRARPSIEYLELYAVAVGVLNWIHRFQNRRIILFCDNISVVYMLNRSTSSCKNCLVLIRIIVLESLRNNARVFANYVNTKSNTLADSLSRLNLKKFVKLARKHFELERSPIPAALWPMEKLWIN